MLATSPPVPSYQLNGQMKTRHIKKYCKLKEDAQTLFETAMHKLGPSARAYTRILKLPRTIADLETSEEIQSHHISEAIQYRTLYLRLQEGDKLHNEQLFCSI